MKSKKILLINPSASASKGINEATVYPPVGLVYIASFLRENDFNEIKIVDANILRYENSNVLEIIEEYKPDIVGIHMNIILGESGAKLSHAIKEKYDMKVCIGGPSVSSNPKETLFLSNADIAIIGEGEETFLEICQDKDLSKIKGIAYRKGKEVIINGTRGLISDLDKLPFPAYDLLPSFDHYKSRARKTPVGVLVSSRGCPYNCTYCNSSVFGKKFRARSPENVIAEIDMLVNKYKIKQLDVLDDNFTLDIDRAEKIMDLIIQRKYKILINLQNGVRADRLTPQLVHKMKKAGVFKVGIGIESGDKEIQKEIKKTLDLDKVVTAIKMFRKEGIITMGFLMLGFPEDTKESIETTINFAIKANPTIANFCILTPFPGTPIYMDLEKHNLLKEKKLFYSSGFYEGKVYHKCKNLTEEELLNYQKKAYSKFNFRFSKILETLLTIKSFSEFKWTLEAGLPLLKAVLTNPLRKH